MVEKYLRYSNYSELPSFGLVEFYVAEKMAPEEFSLFHKIFTPDFVLTPIKQIYEMPYNYHRQT